MNIVLSIIGCLVLIAGIGACVVYRDDRNDDSEDSKRKSVNPFLIVPAIGFALFIFANSFVIIPTGYTGVRSTFGQIDEDTVQNGFNWKIPFVQRIEKVNNKQQDISYEGQIWSETAERAAIYFDNVTVTYQINPEKSAWIYSHVSNYKENLVTSNILSSAIKMSSKSLSNVDATNRGLLEPLCAENLQKALNEKYGGEAVIINKISIAQTDFEDSYNEAIAEKQTAQLAYEKQKIENEKKIEAAKAEAQVKTTQAQAEADAAVIKAKGEADANELLEKSLTDKILKQAYLDKWDGALPKVSSSDDISMILNSKDLDITETSQNNKDTETEE